MSGFKRKWRLRLVAVVAVVVSVGWLWLSVQVSRPGSPLGRLWREAWPGLQVLLWIVGAGLLVWSVRRVADRMGWLDKRRGRPGRWTVWRTAGSWSLKRKAHVLRPTTLGDAGRLRRMRTPALQLGFEIARVPFWLRSVPVFASLDLHELDLGASGTGKTLHALANRVVDAPGAVLATSTKVDMIDHTVAVRRAMGQVWIFNPEGHGGDAHRTNVYWNPLAGCERPAVAKERAGYLLVGLRSGGEVGDREWWDSQGVRVLAVLLHAAAIGGKTMLDVLSWISDPDMANDRVMHILGRSPGGPAWIKNWTQFVATNTNTRTSVQTTIMPALAWLSDPELAMVVMPGEGKRQFDVAEFLRGRGTLYLIARDKPHGSIAPLLTAFTAYIVDGGRELASRCRGGRLDPGLSLILDEAANICPVPLERWLAELRGHGMNIHVGAQDKAQLYARWGQHGGDTIWEQCRVKVIFGEISNSDLLDELSQLCGEYRQKIPQYDAERATSGYTTRMVRHVPPERIREMAESEVLILHTRLRGVIGTTTAIYRRSDVRRARGAEQRAARKALQARLPRQALPPGERQRDSAGDSASRSGKATGQRADIAADLAADLDVNGEKQS